MPDLAARCRRWPPPCQCQALAATNTTNNTTTCVAPGPIVRDVNHAANHANTALGNTNPADVAPNTHTPTAVAHNPTGDLSTVTNPPGSNAPENHQPGCSDNVRADAE